MCETPAGGCSDRGQRTGRRRFNSGNHPAAINSKHITFMQFRGVEATFGHSRRCTDKFAPSEGHNESQIMSAPTQVGGVGGWGRRARGRTLVSRERPRLYNQTKHDEMPANHSTVTGKSAPPIFFCLSRDGWRFGIFHLHQMRRTPGTVGRAEPLWIHVDMSEKSKRSDGFSHKFRVLVCRQSAVTCHVSTRRFCADAALPSARFGI
jgi:hypothetical protein